MAAHRYWRIYVDANNGFTQTGIVEIEFREVLWGADVTAPGTTAPFSGGAGSDFSGDGPGNAFDDSSASSWVRGTGSPCWVGYDFGASPKDIAQVSILCDASTLDPKDFRVQSSDDGSTYTDEATITGQTGWQTNIPRHFVVGTPTHYDQPLLHQFAAYAFASQPADEARLNQAVVQAWSQGETSTGLPVKLHQVVGYAWVKGKRDRMDLRAWPLVQDDHVFYGLQLGSAGTIVFDRLTGQWTNWLSPDFTYFRVNDMVDWEGFNLGCDTESGIIWKVDPVGRLDNDDTFITSTVTGQATVRMRRIVPCYMAEVAVSEASPATTGTSIQLRTSDDGGASFIDHGTVDGQALGTSTLFRFYGLGTMSAPGRVFQIVNNGYARRLDGLDIEAGRG